MLIADEFFGSFDLEKIKHLHLFLSIEKNREVETGFIYERIRQDYPQIKTIIPRVDFEHDKLDNFAFTTDTKLILNKWGIPEPDDGEITAANMIDVVLLPLLCFDRRGFRVGYGKGFYDRFLQSCRKDCLKIGLNYFPPVEEISDTHEKDVM